MFAKRPLTVSLALLAATFFGQALVTVSTVRSEELLAKSDKFKIQTTSNEFKDGKKRIGIDIDVTGATEWKPGDPLPYEGHVIYDTATITIIEFEGSQRQWICKTLSSGDQKCYWK